MHHERTGLLLVFSCDLTGGPSDERELIPIGQTRRNSDYGSWRRLPPTNPEVMLVASSTSNELMNITLQPKNHSEQARSDSQTRSGSVTSEFSEARHQLMLESRHKAARTVRNGTGQLKARTSSSGLLEEAVYWFLTAPAIAYVVYSAFGL